MNSNTTPDEQPKEEVAKAVVSQKRRYFVPTHGISVLATDAAAAAKRAESKKVKESDPDPDEEGDV